MWTAASSSALVTTAATELGTALYTMLGIIIPLAVAVGAFFFAYGWLRGVFSNRR